jgi:MFS family permease
MLIGSGIMFISLFLLGLEPRYLNISGKEIEPLIFLSGLTLLSGLGMGIASPASNVACIELLPTRASTIQGVRGMFRQSGGAISIAVTTFLLQYMDSLDQGFSLVFIGSAIITLATIPFILAMPDRAEVDLAQEKS